MFRRGNAKVYARKNNNLKEVRIPEQYTNQTSIQCNESVEITTSTISTNTEAYSVELLLIDCRPLGVAFKTLQDISQFFSTNCEMEIIQQLSIRKQKNKNQTLKLKCAIEFINDDGQVWEHTFSNDMPIYLTNDLRLSILQVPFAQIIANIADFQMVNRNTNPQIFRLINLSMHMKNVQELDF